MIKLSEGYRASINESTKSPREMTDRELGNTVADILSNYEHGRSPYADKRDRIRPLVKDVLLIDWDRDFAKLPQSTKDEIRSILAESVDDPNEGFSHGDRVFLDWDGGGAGTIRSRIHTKTGGIHTGRRNDMYGSNVRNIIEYKVDLDNGWETVFTSETRKGSAHRMFPVGERHGYTIESIANGQYYAHHPTITPAVYRELVESSLTAIHYEIDQIHGGLKS